MLAAYPSTWFVILFKFEVLLPQPTTSNIVEVTTIVGIWDQTFANLQTQFKHKHNLNTISFPKTEK